MPDDDDALEVPFDPPDADLTYRYYCETCRRLGVRPVSRDRAEGLITEWMATLVPRLPRPPTKH